MLETSSNSHATPMQRKQMPIKKYTVGTTETFGNPTKSQLDVSSNAGLSTNTKSNISPSIISHSSSAASHVAPQSQTPSASCMQITQLKLDLVDTSTTNLDTELECSIRKRTVNWQSPVHKFATSTQEKQQQTSPQSVSTTSSTHTSQMGENSSVSSNSPCMSPTKTVRIDECVQEFYDDLIRQTTDQQSKHTMQQPAQQQPNVGAGVIENTTSNSRRTLGEDDGFESLNGKSSSGEDTNASPRTQRLRLNILGNHQRLQQLGEVRANNLKQIQIHFLVDIFTNISNLILNYLYINF